MSKTKQIHHAYYYAQALYELAKESNTIDSTLEEMEYIAQIFESLPNFAIFLGLPFIENSVKSKIVQGVFGNFVSSIVQNLLKILVVKDHIPLLSLIMRLYAQQSDVELKRIRAEVFTVQALRDSQREQLTTFLHEFFQQDVIISNIIKPEILGGMIVHGKDFWLDTSISGHLKRVQNKLQEKVRNMAREFALLEQTPQF